MILELTGVSVRNKGAELMAIAVRKHFCQHARLVRLGVTERFGLAADREQHGLAYISSSMRYGRNRRIGRLESLRTRLAMKLLPTEVRGELGFVSPEQVKGLIDASGFAFGDQHHPSRARHYVKRAEQVKQQGGKVILLPQAFGPFERPEMRDEVRKLFGFVDLAYARDEDSYEHLVGVVGASDRIRKCPDFTIPIAAQASGTDNRVLTVVPNSRMMDKLAKSESERYVPLLGQVFDWAGNNGLTARLLLHDKDEDKQFVELLTKHRGRPVETISDPDPLKLKKYLAESQIVVGSRFHALVGALSSGVPAIGVGWSHK